MATIYSASWVIPVASPPIVDGAVAVDGDTIVAVGPRQVVEQKFGPTTIKHFDHSAILPGFVNVHTHLELTAMRGYLENEETDFFAWLRKLTLARLERMTADDLRVSAAWGACEAVRAGITAVGDASDSAVMSMTALKDVGLRGVVFQESFGPDARLIRDNFLKLKDKTVRSRELQSALVKVGVSPHSPYTVCGEQLELIAEFAVAERLPLMMHAAESEAEELLLQKGCGLFADGLAKRNIEWQTPGLSPIQYLKQRNILATSPLLAHCIRVDERDIEAIAESGSKIAHCPKSNAKLGHGRAPFSKFLDTGIRVGLGSDSVASNNTCDILEEARFAALIARYDRSLTAVEVLSSATAGGARCLELEGLRGELTEGGAADFVVLSLNGPHQLPNYDPVSTTVFSSSGRDVVATVVAGQEVFADGRVVTVDEDRLRARMAEIAEKLLA